LVKESLKPVIRRNIFEMQKDDELRVNLRHLVYYILSWIAYIDDYYNIHEVLKKKNYKYLVRMY